MIKKKKTEKETCENIKGESRDYQERRRKQKALKEDEIERQ